MLENEADVINKDFVRFDKFVKGDLYWTYQNKLRNSDVRDIDIKL